MSIIFGLIIGGIGVSLVIKTEGYLNAFGRIQFFEEHLGYDGGSRLGYKLIGLLLIFLGILAITGLYNGFMMGLLSPLLRAGK